MLDPYTHLMRVYGLSTGGPREQSPIQPLDPETESGLLSHIGQSALEGLAWIGGTLDKPGRAVRGLLAGKPREALAALPLPTDAMGITRPEDVTYGVDLLGLPHDTSLFSSGGLAGLGAEIALDPLTYLSLGGSALTKLGKVARKAGVLPTTLRGRLAGLGGDMAQNAYHSMPGFHGPLSPAQLAQGADEATRSLAAAWHGVPAAQLTPEQILGVANQPLGSIAKFGPWNLGTGQAGLNFLDALKQSPILNNPVTRTVGQYLDPLRRAARAAFDYRVQNTMTEPVQQAAIKATQQFEKTGLPSAVGKQVDLARQLLEGGAEDQGRLLRVAGELKPGGAVPMEAGRQLAGLPGEAQQAIGDVAQGMEQSFAGQAAREAELGLNTHELDDAYARYQARYKSQLPKSSKGYGYQNNRALPLTHPSQKGREDMFRNIVGGTEGLNQLIGDQGLHALARSGNKDDLARAAENIFTDYLGFSPSDLAQHEQLKDLKLTSKDQALLKRQVTKNKKAWQEAVDNFGAGSPEATAAKSAFDQAEADLTHYADQLQRFRRLDSAVSQSRELAGFLKGVDPKYIGNAEQRYFGNHPLHDFLRRTVWHERVTANADAMHDLFAHSAAQFADPATARAAGYVPLSDAFAKVGMGKMGKKGGKANAGALDQFMRRSGGLDPATHYLPRQLVDDAARMMDVLKFPEALQPFIHKWDQLTNLTKMGQTSLWPAFHVRNFLSGAVQNWLTGSFSLKAYKDAFDLHAGKVIKGANELPIFKGLGLTDEQATKQLADLGMKFGLTGHKYGVFSDIVGANDAFADYALPHLAGPGRGQPGPVATTIQGGKQFVKDLVGAARGDQAAKLRANPLNTMGAGANVDMWAPAATGRKVGQMVEEAGRMSGFIEKLRQGLDPFQAAMEIKAAHYDYRRLSDFERQVMRRLIPFYSWIRMNTPALVNQVLEKPGGKAAQLYRAGTRSRGPEDTYLPDWLGEGFLHGLGKPNAAGEQRFISQLGIPLEDPISLLTPRGWLSSLNPIIKTPLELATGQQFYSGRDLADLYGFTGQVTPDQLIYNSPIGRAVRSYQQVVDPRKELWAKLLNLGTGVRVTDANMDVARDVELRDYFQRMLRTSPRIGMFEKLYPRREMLSQLTPEEVTLLRLQATRDQHRRERLQQLERMGLYTRPSRMHITLPGG